MLATHPVGFRKGAEGLAALVRETLGADPFSEAIYVCDFEPSAQANRTGPLWPVSLAGCGA